MAEVEHNDLGIGQLNHSPLLSQLNPTFVNQGSCKKLGFLEADMNKKRLLLETFFLNLHETEVASYQTEIK